jgi:integrase
MKRSRYQLGALFTEPRKKGPAVWVYRWRETNSDGKRHSRKEILGTVIEIRTQADAQRAAEKLRLSINRLAAEGSGPPATIRKLVDHYLLKEIPIEESHEGKRRSTKLGYLSNLNCHIVPRWGDYPPSRVTTVEVEDWLKSIRLAPASRAKIRNVLSMIFRHGMRWGWLDSNPVTMVRCSSKRLRRPDILTAEEFRALLAALPDRERLMGTICATTGLRICEVLGLKWEDIAFEAHMANVLRSFTDGSIGPCKTEISEQPVPLDEIVVEKLLAWHPVCGFPKLEDWVFASYQTFGKMPMWPDSLRRKILQPIAREVGIRKQIGWHTFRRTYSTLLAETGNDVKVVQELMRHAKISTTMEVYTQAGMPKKRLAQRKAVDVLFNRSSDAQREAVLGASYCSHTAPTQAVVLPDCAR